MYELIKSEVFGGWGLGFSVAAFIATIVLLINDVIGWQTVNLIYVTGGAINFIGVLILYRMDKQAKISRDGYKAYLVYPLLGYFGISAGFPIVLFMCGVGALLGKGIEILARGADSILDGIFDLIESSDRKQIQTTEDT